MRGNRATVIGPIGVGIGHVILVLGVLHWLGYPLYSFAGTAILQHTALIGGLFLVAFVPVLLFTRTQLVVPLGMGAVGFGIAIIAGLVTPSPAFATLGEHVLVVGPTYLGSYANGWYVWLLAYGLSGVCEHAIRTRGDRGIDTQALSDWNFPLDRRQSVLFGCAVGLVHTAVFFALGLEQAGELPSGWVLGWGVLGTMLLGLIPILLLGRSQLIAPVAGLVAIVLATGIETVMTTDGTPVSSYLLFWPVYAVLLALLALGESMLRWGRRKMMVYRQTA